MKRDIHKAIEEGRGIARRHERLDLTTTEAKELFDTLKERKESGNETEAELNTITDAFYFGLAIGYRNN